MVNLARCATLFAVVALASTSALAADCAADADEANAKCYPTLQAAVDAALASDLPLVLPRGTYRITAPLVIDYSRHAGTGFELISRGATIDGTAVGGPALIIECAADCFYFHQEGTLFVNADTDGPAVVFGKADFSDPHNSGKLDHLIVNNRNAGAHATGCQFNYVLNWDIDAVCVSAGGGIRHRSRAAAIQHPSRRRLRNNGDGDHARAGLYLCQHLRRDRPRSLCCVHFRHISANHEQHLDFALSQLPNRSRLFARQYDTRADPLAIRRRRANALYRTIKDYRRRSARSGPGPLPKRQLSCRDQSEPRQSNCSHEDPIGRRVLGAHPDPARETAHQRFRADHLVRCDVGAHRHRMRLDRVGRGQGPGRQHGGQPGADRDDQRGVRAAAGRRRPPRHHPVVGNPLQREPRPLRAAGGEGLPGAGAARHHNLGFERRRLRAVGHSRQIARGAGLAAARRPPVRDDARLCLGRLGGTGQDRRAAVGIRRGRRVSRRQDAGRHHRRRSAPLGAPGAPRRAPRSAPTAG